MENAGERSAMCWLRCNKCYRMMKRSTRTFSLTQCRHLFCSECIVGEKKCPECESRGVKIVPLAVPLQQPLSHYFENVGKHVERGYDAAHFQRIQAKIAFRRFADIQGKYEEMKRTFQRSAEQMKSLVEAYGQLKKKHASIAADIVKLQSNPPLSYGEKVKDTTNPNIRDSADRFLQQGRHTMVSFRSNLNESRKNSGPSSLNSSLSSMETPEKPNWPPVSSLNSSRSSIATPLQEHRNRYPSQHHMLQSGYHNRPTREGPEHRYISGGQSELLGYAPRVIASHVVTPMKDSRHLDTGWTATNRRLGSAGVSTEYSSTGGTIRHSPMVIDNYPTYS